MKKLMCTVLTLSLIMTAAMPSFAASATAKGLEEAILLVRSVVDIPEDLTEFASSSHEQQMEDGTTMTLWNLSWNDKDYNSSIHAYVDHMGNLVDYYRYNFSEETGLAKVSREEGARVSEAFLEKAVPAGIAAGMKRVNEADNKTNTYALNYTYQYHHGEIPVPAMTVSISVDKYEGYVSSFYGLGEGAIVPAFDNLPAELTLEQAKEVFLNKVGVKLQYHSYYDYSAKTLAVFPAYSMTSMGESAIDAKTGELVPLYTLNGAGSQSYKDAAYSQGGGYTVMMGDSGELTAAELSAVENISGLISKDAAEKALRNAAAITSTMKLESSSLYQNSIEPDKYVWSFYFDEASGEVDARTGEVLSFYIYSSAARDGKLSVSREKAQQTAEDFLAKTAGDKFSQTALGEEPEGPVLLRSIYVPGANYHVFQYYQQVNGIDFVSNNLTVYVSASTGQIYRYYSNWYDKVSFPSVSEAISASDAFDILNEAADLKLTYGMTSEKIASLVYTLNGYVPYMVNPADGQKINYTGKAYTENAAASDYTDLDGHWCRNLVEELMQNGYYLQGETFRPDEKITQMDFLRYLYADNYWYDEDEYDEFYGYLIRRGVVKEEEKNPTGELARKDAAKFMIRHLGLGLAGEQSSIYINSFTDQVDSDYLGFAALAQSLGIMQGNKAGAFNGNVSMTRAEAASAIYQLLQVK